MWKDLSKGWVHSQLKFSFWAPSTYISSLQLRFCFKAVHQEAGGLERWKGARVACKMKGTFSYCFDWCHFNGITTIALVKADYYVPLMSICAQKEAITYGICCYHHCTGGISLLAEDRLKRLGVCMTQPVPFMHLPTLNCTCSDNYRLQLTYRLISWPFGNRQK